MMDAFTRRIYERIADIAEREGRPATRAEIGEALRFSTPRMETGEADGYYSRAYNELRDAGVIVYENGHSRLAEEGAMTK